MRMLMTAAALLLAAGAAESRQRSFTLDGASFNLNIPDEYIFTKREKVDARDVVIFTKSKAPHIELSLARVDKDEQKTGVHERGLYIWQTKDKAKHWGVLRRTGAGFQVYGSCFVEFGCTYSLRRMVAGGIWLEGVILCIGPCAGIETRELAAQIARQ